MVAPPVLTGAVANVPIVQGHYGRGPVLPLTAWRCAVRERTLVRP
jgi:hypothetical protein